MKILIYSLFICNLLTIYFYSISQSVSKFFKIELNSYTKIILGYSVNILLISFIYFTFKFKNIFLYCILSLLCLLIFFNAKNYFDNFFNKKINLFLNLSIIIISLPAIIYGEQFYIFRGNYWDSSHYLNSALLFNYFSYNEILNLTNPLFFDELNTMKVVVTGRPMINYILSIFLNLDLSIFYLYYLLKTFITVLIFLSLVDFTNYIIGKKNIDTYFVSFVFIFSFFNLYVFEIDALSHYASIPILLSTMKYILLLFNNLNNKQNYYFLAIFLSSLFIIYPEIIIVPALFFMIIFFDSFKVITKNNIFSLFILLALCLILTLPTYSITYKFLFSNQLSQATRQSDWWGYFGSFIFGKDNLVLNIDFVNQLKESLSKDFNLTNIINFIHNEHFKQKFYFIYLNIFPSLFGLYYLVPGQIESKVYFVIYTILIIVIYLYLSKIIIKNSIYFLKKNKTKKKFLFTIIITFLFIGFLFIKGNYWTIIKLYTYLFPFVFIFFAYNFETHKFNNFYLILISLFFVYKFSTFNSGIGRYDSFPSIINPILKKNINWSHKYEELKNCDKIYLKNDNYIMKTYLNLKKIDLDLDNKYDKNRKKNCKVNLNNKKFNIVYE